MIFTRETGEDFFVPSFSVTSTMSLQEIPIRRDFVQGSRPRMVTPLPASRPLGLPSGALTPLLSLLPPLSLLQGYSILAWPLLLTISLGL